MILLTLADGLNLFSRDACLYEPLTPCYSCIVGVCIWTNKKDLPGSLLVLLLVSEILTSENVNSIGARMWMLVGRTEEQLPCFYPLKTE